MTNNWNPLKISLKNELDNILTYWKNNTVDSKNGGFIGRIDYPDIKRENSSKGVILNTRILWTFSAASIFYTNDRYRDLRERSYEYIKKHFKDPVYGGVFWILDANGNPINKRKQVYAQSFAIYALSEYYLCTKNEESKNWAIEIFDLIEKYALDNEHNGYIEAFNEDWSPIGDMRLSDKDHNEAKTMNTHLHILEAYTNLYRIYPDKKVWNALQNLVVLFLNKFLNTNGHLHLFFDESWELKSTIYSYGHDIETAWLLIEAAKALENEELLKKVEKAAILITDTFVAEAIDEDGGVINEIDYKTGDIDKDKHWWQQAEAIVGLYYAYQIEEKEIYLSSAKRVWDFIDTHMIDHEYGEWFWLIGLDGTNNPENEKVGMWKCPYHNSRSCLQLNKVF